MHEDNVCIETTVVILDDNDYRVGVRVGWGIYAKVRESPDLHWCTARCCALRAGRQGVCLLAIDHRRCHNSLIV